MGAAACTSDQSIPCMLWPPSLNALYAHFEQAKTDCGLKKCVGVISNVAAANNARAYAESIRMA